MFVGSEALRGLTCGDGVSEAIVVLASVFCIDGINHMFIYIMLVGSEALHCLTRGDGVSEAIVGVAT
eukprot:5617725-Lingulodinium_polyedra.AAC.1